MEHLLKPPQREMWNTSAPAKLNQLNLQELARQQDFHSDPETAVLPSNECLQSAVFSTVRSARSEGQDHSTMLGKTFS